MGLLSKLGKGIGKIFKGVWKGITKVFKAVMKPISKLLDSKIGKAIMLGVTLFTLGPALMAGGKAFLAGEGFIARFVDAGSAFMDSLLGGTLEGGAEAAATGNAPAGVGGTGGGTISPTGVSSGASEVMGMSPELGVDAMASATGANPLAGAGVTPSVKASQLANVGVGGGAAPTMSQAAAATNFGANAGGGGNWLSKAAKAAGDFVKSPGGGTIVGKMIEGVGTGMMMKDKQEFDSRVERMFANPNDPGMQALAGHDYSINAPPNLAGEVAANATGSVARPVPTVPYRRTPYQGG
jgi:hypothetical protein